MKKLIGNHREIGFFFFIDTQTEKPDKNESKKNYEAFGKGLTQLAKMVMVVMVVENIILYGVQGQQPTLSQARWLVAATSVGKYALFGGGFTGSDSNVVDIWDSETNVWTKTTLSQARGFLSATSAGNYALFGGGDSDSGLSNVVDIWSIENNSRIATSLSQARGFLSATSVGKYALFGGGVRTGGYSNVVDIWYAPTQSWVNGTVFQNPTCIKCNCELLF
jgi:hypothetical protein